MSDTLFDVEGDRFLPTGLCRGGWDDQHQHGGPPSLLLGRALEALPTERPMQIVRFTIDLIRPVPLRPLRVVTGVDRDGLRIQRAHATLFAEDVEVAIASCLKIRTTDLPLDLPNVDQRSEELGPPEDADPVDWQGRFGEEGPLERFHFDAIEIRTFDDSFVRFGEGRSWMRLRVPIIGGEQTSPFLDALAVADVGNGNSQRLDPFEWLYVNADITLSLHRLPVDEWVGMRSVARQEATGVGLAETVVFDRTGRIGSTLQSQVIQRH